MCGNTIPVALATVGAKTGEEKVEGYVLFVNGISQTLGDISEEEAIKDAQAASARWPNLKVELAERVVGRGASIIWSSVSEKAKEIK